MVHQLRRAALKHAGSRELYSRAGSRLGLYHLVADEEAESYTIRQTAIYDVLDAKAVGSRELYSQAGRRLSGIGGYTFCCRDGGCVRSIHGGM